MRNGIVVNIVGIWLEWEARFECLELYDCLVDAASKLPFSFLKLPWHSPFRLPITCSFL